MLWSKTGIKNHTEYSQLFTMLSDAREAIITGSAKSGTHYLLIHHLSSVYGIRASGREAAMKEAEKLLEQWERDNSENGLSDSEYSLLDIADNW